MALHHEEFLQAQYQLALLNPQHETRDLCCTVTTPEQLELIIEQAKLGPSLTDMVKAGAVRHVRDIRGAGGEYDLRSLANPNFGTINPLIGVQHIPVIRQMAGVDDFMVLLRVLQDQGLMVQKATDASGNVCHYTNFSDGCYQARGANQVSWGAEHMHATIDEVWTKRQLRAAAYLIMRSRDGENIPVRMADLNPGPGVVRVARTGITSHENVSNNAGYNDRSDPGPGFDYDYVFSCVDYWDAHGHFEGA